MGCYITSSYRKETITNFLKRENNSLDHSEQIRQLVKFKETYQNSGKTSEDINNFLSNVRQVKKDNQQIDNLFKIQSKIGYCFHGDTYKADRMMKIIEEINKVNEGIKLKGNPILFNNPPEKYENQETDILKRSDSRSTVNSFKSEHSFLESRSDHSDSKFMNSILNRETINNAYTDHNYWQSYINYDRTQFYYEQQVQCSSQILNRFKNSMNGIINWDNRHSIGDLRSDVSEKFFVKTIESYSLYYKKSLVDKDKQSFMKIANHTIFFMHIDKIWSLQQSLVATEALNKLKE